MGWNLLIELGLAVQTNGATSQLYAINPTLKYIFVARNGLDMAYSNNLNQALLWGKPYTGIDFDSSPRYVLKYLCAVNNKMDLLSEKMRNNFFFLNFDKFCLNKEKEMKQLMEFLGVNSTEFSEDTIIDLVRKPQSTGRFKRFSLDALDTKDIESVSKMRFDTSF